MILQEAQLISGRQGYGLFQTLKERAVHVKEVNVLASFALFLNEEPQFLYPYLCLYLSLPPSLLLFLFQGVALQVNQGKP